MSGLTMKALQEQINKLNEEVAILKANSKSCVLRKNLGIGDIFELHDIAWKIIDITESGYLCLAERLTDEMKFDSNSSDWKTSSIRKYLNGDFYDELCEEIGAENIIPFKRDLLSLDGQKEYGTCEDKVSLLSVDEYRKYRELISNDKDWWWLITPWSTPCNDYKQSVAVVSPSGYFGSGHCYIHFGVRPFCIFSSSIFES